MMFWNDWRIESVLMSDKLEPKRIVKILERMPNVVSVQVGTELLGGRLIGSW